MTIEFSWVIPLYNDAASVDWIVATSLKFLQSLQVSYEIVLVNDGSKDLTLEKAQGWAMRNPCIQVLSHAKNRGYGHALRSGFQAAKATQWIGYTDGDAQYNPLDLQSHWQTFRLKRETALLGYKTNRADGVYRRLQSWVFSRLVRLLFRVDVRDINCSLKIFPAASFNRLYLQGNSAFIDCEIILKLQQQNVSFQEVPVHHFQRGELTQQPVSSGHGAKLKTVVATLKEMLRYKTHANLTHQL